MNICLGICIEKLVNAFKGVIGMFFITRALKPLNSIVRIQPRIMRVSFNDNLCKAIISFYRPTNASDETDFIFHNELSSLVQHIPKPNLIIIVRKNEWSYKPRRK